MPARSKKLSGHTRITMKVWSKLLDYVATLKLVTTVASWTRIPQVVMLNKIIRFLETLLIIARNQLVKINQEHSDRVVDSTTEAGNRIEEERNRPMPEQNNDVLREETRNRNRGAQ